VSLLLPPGLRCFLGRFGKLEVGESIDVRQGLELPVAAGGEKWKVRTERDRVR
jgi:hypothetical protein